MGHLAEKSPVLWRVAPASRRLHGRHLARRFGAANMPARCRRYPHQDRHSRSMIVRFSTETGVWNEESPVVLSLARSQRNSDTALLVAGKSRSGDGQPDPL